MNLLSRQKILLFISLAALPFIFPEKAWLLFLISWALVIFAFLRSTKKVIVRGGVSLILISGCLLPIIYFKLFSKDGMMPFGLSFFAIHLISFLVDRFRGKISPAFSLGDFLLYLFYLPKFFVGPIERFSDFQQRARSGVSISRPILLGSFYLLSTGFFKCQVIAPQAGGVVQRAFQTSALPWNFFTTIVLSYTGALALYCEFSGYVDIARAISKIFGIELSRNFNFPYSATSLQDFWQRWHITFSDWLRDYVFYPLFQKTKSVHFSAFVTIFLMGVWHGRRWNFIFAGLYYTIGVVGLSVSQSWMNRLKSGLDGRSIALYRWCFWFLTLQFTSFGLFLLLLPNVNALVQALQSLLVFRINLDFLPPLIMRFVFFAAPVILVERVLQRKNGNENDLGIAGVLKSSLIIIYITFLIRFFSAEKSANEVEFLYFQF